jgi:hypothetical protein
MYLLWGFFAHCLQWWWCAFIIIPSCLYVRSFCLHRKRRPIFSWHRAKLPFGYGLSSVFRAHRSRLKGFTVHPHDYVGYFWKGWYGECPVLPESQ